MFTELDKPYQLGVHQFWFVDGENGTFICWLQSLTGCGFTLWHQLHLTCQELRCRQSKLLACWKLSTISADEFRWANEIRHEVIHSDCYSSASQILVEIQITWCLVKMQILIL